MQGPLGGTDVKFMIGSLADQWRLWDIATAALLLCTGLGRSAWVSVDNDIFVQQSLWSWDGALQPTDCWGGHWKRTADQIYSTGPDLIDDAGTNDDVVLVNLGDSDVGQIDWLWRVELWRLLPYLAVSGAALCASQGAWLRSRRWNINAVVPMTCAVLWSLPIGIAVYATLGRCAVPISYPFVLVPHGVASAFGCFAIAFIAFSIHLLRRPRVST